MRKRSLRLHTDFKMASQSPATPAALYKMISIPDAQAVVLQETRPLATRTVKLEQAVGSILTADVLAQDSLPPFPASIKVEEVQAMTEERADMVLSCFCSI